MEKLEYLARMLNRRTNGKDYENMIVNAIYNGVGNPDLIPVTQQYVLVNDNGNKRHHLLDLYFPQLNYGVEVDEGQHMSEEHTISDQQRAENIIKAIECKEDRVRIFTEDKQLRSYKDVFADVNKVIETIKQLIKDLDAPLKWELNEERKANAFASRTFSSADDVDFDGGVTDIYNQITGKSVKNLGRSFVKLNEQYQLWCPNLLLDDETDNKLNSNWQNYISEDKQTIKEYDLRNIWNGKTGEFKEPRLRVVFMHMKDKYGMPCLRFMGVYEATEQILDKDNVCCRIYKKKADVYTY